MTLRIVALITLIASLLAPQAHAQGFGGRGFLSETDPASLLSSRIGVEFGGGTVADYLNAIQEAVGGRSIVITQGLDDIEMEPVELSAVRYIDAIMLVKHLPVPAGAIHVSQEGDTFVIWAQRDTREVAERLNAQHVLVRSLATMLRQDVYAPEDVLGAIEAALATEGAEPTTELRYHEPTSLLIARGPFRMLEAIDSTLQHLMDASDEIYHMEHDEDSVEHDLRREFEEHMEHQSDEFRRTHIETQQVMERQQDIISELRNELQQAREETLQMRRELLERERDFVSRIAELEVELEQARRWIEENQD